MIFIKKRIENISTFKVLYMRRIGAYGKDNIILMNKFKELLKQNNLFNDDTVIFAIPMDNPHIIEPNKYRYDVCIIDSCNKKINSNDIHNRYVIGGKYIIFLIEHSIEAIQNAWIECFNELEKEGYTLDNSRQIMERYEKRLVDRHYCEICVPIL